jgi:hypothetical protein
MLQVIFSLFVGVSGILCLALCFFTWAASGAAGGPGKTEKRVIGLSFLFGVALICLALWLVGAL